MVKELNFETKEVIVLPFNSNFTLEITKIHNQWEVFARNNNFCANKVFLLNIPESDSPQSACNKALDYMEENFYAVKAQFL